MIPSLTLPITQTAAPAPVNNAVVASVPAQTAQNLVYQAVPANSSPVALFNNVRGSSAEPLQGRNAEVISQALTQTSEPLQRQTQTFRYGFNSAFLAQAMAQEEVANDNESLYRAFEAQEEVAQAPALQETSVVPRYIENEALHLSSLQRVSIKAYQTTVSRNMVSLNQPALLSLARAA